MSFRDSVVHRAIDVISGMIAGGAAWIALSAILTIIPFAGWVIAAMIAGYLAGRIGGGYTALFLALLTPAITWIIGYPLLSVVVSFLPHFVKSIMTGIFGEAFTAVIIVWAIINLVFVSLGGAIGRKYYHSTHCQYCSEKVSPHVTTCPTCRRRTK